MTKQTTISEAVEEQKQAFVEKWNTGQFERNHKEGDKLGTNEISLWRVWNDFIEPVLTKAYEAGREEASRCKKPVEGGKAICGCKLDCHLHDWRQGKHLTPKE